MPEAFVMAGEITKEFAQNRADHEEFRATHEEFRREFAQNRADHRSSGRNSPRTAATTSK